MEDSLYERISNPLDNSRFVKEMLYNYIYFDDLGFILTSNVIDDNDKYSMTFHDVLFKNNYDDWVGKITNLYESLDVNDSNYNDVKTLYEFLKSHTVKSFKDVSNVINEGYRTYPEIFKKYCSIGQDREGYKVINTFGTNDFEHCLAINCNIKKMHLFVYKFYEKCKSRGLDYFIKFNETGKNNLGIKIYCNTDDLEVYLNIVKEVIEENNLESDLDSLPLVVGEISRGVGYLSGEADFIRKRADHIGRCIETVTIDWIEKNIDSNMKTATGRDVPYKYYLFSKVILNKKSVLLNNPNLYPSDEINTREFSYIMTEHLLKNYKNVLNAVLNKDLNYKFSVPFKSSTIMFTYEDFKDILKTQADYFRNSNEYQDDILKMIREKSYIWSIDSDNYGIDTECSYLLGKKRPQAKSRVTIDVLNNFDTTASRKPTSSREGRILDSDISRKKKPGFFDRFRKK